MRRIRGSSNGRTPGSGPGNLGSNPGPRANKLDTNLFFEDESVRSSSLATSGAGFVFATASSPNFVFCFAKCAANTVALDPPRPFARNIKEFPE